MKSHLWLTVTIESEATEEEASKELVNLANQLGVNIHGHYREKAIFINCRPTTEETCVSSVKVG